MFEGKLPKPGAYRPLDNEPAENDRLRPLSWEDLAARLSAARELRAALRVPRSASEGSFDAGSARRMAAHFNGKQPVNLEDSSNGKAAERTAAPIGPGPTPGVRPAPRGSK